MTKLGHLVVLLLGIGMFILAFAWSVPATSDLTLVEGHLSSSSVKHSTGRFGESKSSYTVLFHTREGGKFYNETMDEETARRVFLRPGAALRFYIEPAAKRTLAGGERATYGLWVDGTEVQRVEEAVADERFVVRRVFPVLGILFVGTAVFLFRRQARIDSRYRTPTRR